jgi:hypothetical protein
MRITSGGLVGVGTTSPIGSSTERTIELAGGSNNSTFYVTKSSSGIRSILGASDNGTIIGAQSNHNIAIVTNDTTRIFVSSGGSVGIGTTSPSYPLTRSGMTMKAATNDGTEFVMLSCADTGFLGGALVRNGADFGVINRTNGNLIFATNAQERLYITGAGIACFACQTCTPQSVITSGFYSTSNMIIITNDVQDGRKTILNNTPVSIFQICKPAGLASSASYSLLGGHLYINLGLRFSGGYTALRTITYPFFINSAGLGNISLVLGTPTCLTGFDNTGGETTSFGISLCGASNTTATVIVCASTTNFTIEGSTIMTVSMVANRTALLDEPISVFKI